MRLLLRIGAYVIVFGGFAYGCSRLMSVKTPGYVENQVGVHKIETGEVGADGEPTFEYRETFNQKPPYQFMGGLEGGDIPGSRAKSSTRAVFLPRGVFQVTGVAFGDCVENMDASFSVSAYSLAANREEHPYFINLDGFLPSTRGKREYEGILRIDNASKYIFEIDSKSPLWTMRVNRLTNKDHVKRTRWAGLHPELKKVDTRKHCETQAQRDAEFDRQQSERQRRIDRQILRDSENFMREQQRLNRKYD